MSSNTKLAEKLEVILADSYILYLKTQNYHWNVTGPNFSSLHVLFEQQYTDLAAAIDEIAERIRTLGKLAPGSFKAFAALGTLTEAGEDRDATGMVKDLYEDNLSLAKYLQKAIELAEDEGDAATAGLLTDRLTIHEKHAWMLGASM